jgi:hypothetical protein
MADDFRSDDFRIAENLGPADFSVTLPKECVLFYHPSCSELAARTAAASPGVTLGQIDWGCAL